MRMSLAGKSLNIGNKYDRVHSRVNLSDVHRLESLLSWGHKKSNKGSVLPREDRLTFCVSMSVGTSSLGIKKKQGGDQSK